MIILIIIIIKLVIFFFKNLNHNVWNIAFRRNTIHYGASIPEHISVYFGLIKSISKYDSQHYGITDTHSGLQKRTFYVLYINGIPCS